MSYRASEHQRLTDLGGESLYLPFREGILDYFKRHGISWWGGTEEPTESPISSQVACINHLEPARQDRKVAQVVATNALPGAVDVLPVEDDGFVAYEYVGTQNYLGERGWSLSSRGKNTTSLDALMVAERSAGGRSLIVVEWKFTESYVPDKPLAVSERGTSRVEIYRPLLDDPTCPIKADDHERLFYDPFYQLMRQTLLAWRIGSGAR